MLGERVVSMQMETVVYTGPTVIGLGTVWQTITSARNALSKVLILLKPKAAIIWARLAPIGIEKKPFKN